MADCQWNTFRLLLDNFYVETDTFIEIPIQQVLGIKFSLFSVTPKVSDNLENTSLLLNKRYFLKLNVVYLK